MRCRNCTRIGEGAKADAASQLGASRQERRSPGVSCGRSWHSSATCDRMSQRIDGRLRSSSGRVRSDAFFDEIQKFAEPAERPHMDVQTGPPRGGTSKRSGRSQALDSPVSGEGRVSRMRRTPAQGSAGWTAARQGESDTTNAGTRTYRLAVAEQDSAA